VLKSFATILPEKQPQWCEVPMFINLTTNRGEQVCVNSDHIICFTPSRSKGTTISLTESFELTVTNNSDEILDTLSNNCLKSSTNI
jgi:hypothetical protein